MPLCDVEPRLDSADPSAQLAAYLDYYRAVVARKVGGLTDVQLRTSMLPSGWTPLEMFTHLVHMERRWFVWGFLGEQVADPWGDHAGGAPEGPWHVPADVGLPALVDALEAGGARTNEILATHGLAERGSVGGRFPAHTRRAARARVDLLPRAAGVRPARRAPRRRTRARRRRDGGVARTTSRGPVLPREAPHYLAGGGAPATPDHLGPQNHSAWSPGKPLVTDFLRAEVARAPGGRY